MQQPARTHTNSLRALRSAREHERQIQRNQRAIVNSELRSADRFPVELLRQLPPQTAEPTPADDEPPARVERGARSCLPRR